MATGRPEVSESVPAGGAPFCAGGGGLRPFLDSERQVVVTRSGGRGEPREAPRVAPRTADPAFFSEYFYIFVFLYFFTLSKLRFAIAFLFSIASVRPRASHRRCRPRHKKRQGAQSAERVRSLVERGRPHHAIGADAGARRRTRHIGPVLPPFFLFGTISGHCQRVRWRPCATGRSCCSGACGGPAQSRARTPPGSCR